MGFPAESNSVKTLMEGVPMTTSSKPIIAQAPRPTGHAATKDSGRVNLGGGAMHFGDASPASKATKDLGRVKIGGGALQF
jgi:hypothetical protein